MKEKLYTIPLNDAMNAGDECPFCYIERNVEQDLMDFVLGSGSSYMEADIRDMTDREGFCRKHFKAMFDYGNTLGNAWILKTHYMRTGKEMAQKFAEYKQSKPAIKPKTSVKDKIFMRAAKGNSNYVSMGASPESQNNSVSAWLAKREASCYICNHFAETYERYMDTFFVMYKKDEEFRNKVKESKGFCLSHFGDLCEAAEKYLGDKDREEFFNMAFPLMEENMDRLFEDVSWMVEKFDYRNKDADWKNSKDSIQRGMQKLKGGYPADAPYKMKK